MKRDDPPFDFSNTHYCASTTREELAATPPLDINAMSKLVADIRRNADEHLYRGLTTYTPRAVYYADFGSLDTWKPWEEWARAFAREMHR